LFAKHAYSAEIATRYEQYTYIQSPLALSRKSQQMNLCSQSWLDRFVRHRHGTRSPDHPPSPPFLQVLPRAGGTGADRAVRRLSQIRSE
jgi:hypothetical protein